MKTILVVDDNPFITELVTETLGIENYRILISENGEQAIALAKMENPDLIIMDVMMPGKYSGFDATKIIRSSPLLEDCKVILLTAKGQRKDLETGFRAGADDYIIKPFSPMALLDKVDLLLKGATNNESQ
ncbi:MAG: response regulator transcription factor [Nitrospinales bacterium]